MKEQLVTFETAKLAKEKGFVSTVIGKSVESKMSQKPFKYLWMCELQKWLRDAHNIDINVNRDSAKMYHCMVDGNSKGIEGPFFSLNYEEALEKGLQEALELLKQ